MEWLEIIYGPIDFIFSDLDPRSRSVKVKKSKSFLWITQFKIVVKLPKNSNLAYSILWIILIACESFRDMSKVTIFIYGTKWSAFAEVYALPVFLVVHCKWKTRSSADADKPARRAFRGQSRSPNIIVPFHMLGIYFLLCNSNFVFKTRRFSDIRLQKCRDLEIWVRGHSRSLNGTIR